MSRAGLASKGQGPASWEKTQPTGVSRLLHPIVESLNKWDAACTRGADWQGQGENPILSLGKQAQGEKWSVTFLELPVAGPRDLRATCSSAHPFCLLSFSSWF